jgi:signal transduction histidine kinase
VWFRRLSTGSAGRIVLSIQDDGAGFDSHRIRGLGLLGIEERTTHLGGSFEIQSHPGRGTNLRIVRPLAAISETETNEPDSYFIRR